MCLVSCGRYLNVKPQGKVIPETDEEFATIMHNRICDIEGGYDEKVVVFGIRPEDVYDSEMFIESSPQSVFESTIRVYELLGAEVYLYFDLAEFPITARVDSRTTARPGDTVKFAFDVNNMHIFDKETEYIICH